jgi:hypothetical protein
MMTSLTDRLDYLEALQGVDVTDELGRHGKALERLREARAAVEDDPSIDRCREYVAAHDAFWALIDAAPSEIGQAA